MKQIKENAANLRAKRKIKEKNQNRKKYQKRQEKSAQNGTFFLKKNAKNVEKK